MGGSFQRNIFYKELFKEKAQKCSRIKKDPIFISKFPIGYFDGTSHDNGYKCVAGIVLKLIDDTIINLRLGCGKGNSTRGSC